MVDARGDECARLTEGNNKTFEITDIVYISVMSRMGILKKSEVDRKEFMNLCWSRSYGEQIGDVSRSKYR